MFVQVIIFVAIIVVAVVVHGLLIAAEKSIVAIRPFKLRELSSRGIRNAEILRKIRSNPERFFTSTKTFCIITVSLVSIVAGIFGVTIIGEWLRSIPALNGSAYIKPLAGLILILITTLIFSITSEFFSRIIPENKQEAFALSAAMPILILELILAPFIITSSWIARNVLVLFGISKKTRLNDSLSESEIRMILREGYLNSSLNAYEKKIIYSMLEFSDTDVRRAMTPRTDIAAFDINEPLESILKIATEEKYSRFPVYEENLDNIRGIIHSRDLLYVFTHKELFVLKDVIREAYFVPDSKPIVELLREMQVNKIHMAVVLDEFGGTGGIITLEDILEEIVGDIQDEYDQEVSKIVFINPNKARVLAAMPIDEFADEFNVEVEEGEFDTVAGMLVTGLGKIPARGEIYNFKDFSLEVKEKEGHRIKTLIARRIISDKEL